MPYPWDPIVKCISTPIVLTAAEGMASPAEFKPLHYAFTRLRHPRPQLQNIYISYHFYN